MTMPMLRAWDFQGVFRALPSSSSSGGDAAAGVAGAAASAAPSVRGDATPARKGSGEPSAARS